MPENANSATKSAVPSLGAVGKRRTYNSHTMAERRSRIIAATLEIIEEEGLGSVTIRNVSKRAGVALRTLYLYFDNREAMISVAIQQFFHHSAQMSPDKGEPATVADVIDRLDRLSEVVMTARAYSAALAPIYFSANFDTKIYDVLKNIALSHVFPFLDNALAASRMRPSPQLKAFISTQVANTEYAVINDVLAGRAPEENLALNLKISVLACIAGFLPKPPKDLVRTLEDLQSRLA